MVVPEKAPARKWLKASSKAEQSLCPFGRRCSMVAASVKAMAAPRSNMARRAVSGSGSGGTQWGRSIKNQRLGPMLAAVLFMAVVESSRPRALQHKAKESSVRLRAQ